MCLCNTMNKQIYFNSSILHFYNNKKCNPSKWRTFIASIRLKLGQLELCVLKSVNELRPWKCKQILKFYLIMVLSLTLSISLSPLPPFNTQTEKKQQILNCKKCIGVLEYWELDETTLLSLFSRLCCLHTD